MNFRTVCVWIFGAMLVASAVADRMAVTTASVRLLLVCTVLFGLFTGLVHLVRFLFTRPGSLYPSLFFLALLVTWAVLANKPPNQAMLRAAYVSRLTAFSGCRYLEGGETNRGIGSSGLARVALWQAMLKEGVREVNPRLLGPVLWKFWWRDLGASDIATGKYGYTRVVDTAPKLAGYDTSKLRVGDVAAAGGAHVLIYYGRGEWIEANPDEQRVVVASAHAGSKRSWFNVPVTIVRWWIFEGEN